MEIHFQQNQVESPQKMAASANKASKLKATRAKNNGNNHSKFVGVRQRPSGRWVAEIKDTTQKIRMWLGTFETAEEAARAYDEAACLLRGSNTRTNFMITQVSPDSPLASRIRKLLHSKKNTKQTTSLDSPTTTTNMSPTLANYTTTFGANNTISFAASSPPSSGYCINPGVGAFDYSVVGEKIQQTQMVDHGYRPGLSSCVESYENVATWGGGYNAPFVQEDFARNVAFPEQSSELGFSEYQRMEMERQISASFYAINGVQQECMEAAGFVHDPTTASDALWDLPPLCSLYCPI